MTEPVFFAPARRYTASEIAAFTGAELADEALCDVVIERISPASHGGKGALVFIEGKRNLSLLGGPTPAAILCTPDLVSSLPASVAKLVTAKPQRAFAQVGRLLYPSAARPVAMTGETGISPRAFVADDVTLEEGVIIEAGAVVGKGASIGSGSIIAPNAVIGANVQIGRDCYVGANAVVQYALLGNRVVILNGAQIGQDGFGFVPGPAGLERVPQIGRVILQDDVEIGSNTAVDRGAMSDTVIGEGSKIDNLVQIAHNVRTGRSCVIAGQSGLSGSVTLGDFVMLGGRVGIADHISIGSNAQVAASAGLMDNIPSGERWAGTPARPMREFFREVAAIRGLTKSKKGDSNG